MARGPDGLGKNKACEAAVSQALWWYAWVDSNHRPLDPESEDQILRIVVDTFMELGIFWILTIFTFRFSYVFSSWISYCSALYLPRICHIDIFLYTQKQKFLP